MKNIVKFFTVLALAFLARAVVRRYRPRVVMVTGSVGKTSTKDAVAAVLSTRFFTRKSEKSFNSQYGVPFTILGVGNPWDNPLKWLLVFKNALSLIILPNHYPNMLVLEVGSGKPGDLAEILRIVMPDAVVVTQLPEVPVHVEAYESPEAVREEEFSPAYALPAAAPLIICEDDPYAIEHALRSSAQVTSFGTATDAMVRIENIDFYKEKGQVVGMKASIQSGDERGEVVVKGSVGKTQLFPAAAALAAGRAFGIPLQEALVALEGYEPPPGRGRVFTGRNGSIIIDDSYNASPIAVEEALATLKAFPEGRRRIAVLGDMLELGRYSVMEHARLAEVAGESADLIVTVGIRARAFAESPGHAEVLQFDNAFEAAKRLLELVREGDVLLVKGSQSVRTERIVEALLADAADTVRLVRQEEKWKKKV